MSSPQDSAIDDPEPEPAPVEGAVERAVQRMRAYHDEHEARLTDEAPISWLGGDDGPILYNSDLRAVLDELERLRSPKGGEPATQEAPLELVRKELEALRRIDRRYRELTATILLPQNADHLVAHLSDRCRALLHPETRPR